MDETTTGTGTRVAPEVDRGLSRAGAFLLLLVISAVISVALTPARFQRAAGGPWVTRAARADACDGKAMTSAPNNSAPSRGNPVSGALRASFAQLPLSFEVNRGQADSGVDFLARGSGYRWLLTPTAAELSLASPAPEQAHGTRARRRAVTETKLRVQMVGANPSPRVAGQKKLPGTVGYYLGSDPRKGLAGIPTYAAVRYASVYPGVDLVYYGNQRQLEFDFIVAPGADPKRIRLGFAGADKVGLDRKSGDLVLNVTGGQVRQHKPLIYQEKDGVRRRVDGHYVLRGNAQVGFHVASYDRHRPLIIDPVVSYSTYIGGGDWDEAHAIAIDGAGNAWVTGATYYGGGGRNIFVRKLNPGGTALLLDLTYGNGGEDEGNGIAVDPAGNAYITGKYTFEDAMFPGQDIWDDYRLFVLKLSPAGVPIYFVAPEGSNDDKGNAVAVTTDGYACVTGRSSGGNVRGFPIVGGLTDYKGFGDAIVMVLNPAGNDIVYSTYLGTSGVDEGFGIAAANGSVYVTGLAGGPEFPVTIGAYQTQYGGWFGDAFVTRINPALTGVASIVYSTFLGGDDFDEGDAIAIDAAGNAYVTGSTNTTGPDHAFPTTVGAYQTGWGGGDCDADPLHFEACSDAFVTKLNPSGTGLVYSTYLGGVGRDDGHGIAVDGDGNAYVTGTCLGFFPAVNSLQAYAGGRDAFVTKVDPTGSHLVYSSFLGGKGSETGMGIARDSAGNLYVAGYTDSTDYPTTPGAFHTTSYGGGMDPFVAKIGEGAVPVPSLQSVALNPTSVTGGVNSTGTVTLTRMAPAGGATVTLTNGNTAAATVPASVLVAAGQTNATFTVTTKPVAATATASISAAYGGTTKTATLTVKPVGLASVTLNPATVIGGGTSTGTVTLGGPAAAAVSVTLTSANTAVATVPATVSVAAGASTATFTVTTKAQAADKTVALSAAYGGVTKSANLTVKAPALSSLSLAPSSVAGGNPVIATVALSGPAGVATAVALSSSNTAVATVPASVTVAAGATSAKVTITTKAVAVKTTVTLKATLGSLTKSATLTLNPASVAGLTLSPSTVGGGGTSTGTVTLTGPAAAALSVTLTSANATVAPVPASVSIGAGAKMATFKVTTKAVTADSIVSLSATGGGVTKAATLTVNAAALASVTISPATTKGGGMAIGTVTLSAKALTATLVTLSSSNTTVTTVPAGVTVLAGASSATFSVTSKAVATNATVVIKATSGGLSKTANLSVTP